MRTLVLALFALVTTVAHAEPKLAAATVAYATKNNLPIRGVKTDLGTRQVERHFVPVLPQTEADFYDTFQVSKGAMVWRSGRDVIHPSMSLSPTSRVSTGSAWGAGAVEGHAAGGHYLALAITPEQAAHWQNFTTPFAPAGTMLINGRATYQEPGVKGCYGSCMWYLVHARLAPELNLATAMGVRRAKGPEVLLPRLIHAGNELVGPIGIPVASVAQFMAMTDQQLMGPEPGGGAADQVK